MPKSKTNPPFASWVCQHLNTSRLVKCCLHNIGHKHLPNGASNPKTLTQSNKYCIQNLKPKIQIKLNMALLELIDHESFFIHGIA
jgi:hypothetical protein